MTISSFLMQKRIIILNANQAPWSSSDLSEINQAPESQAISEAAKQFCLCSSWSHNLYLKMMSFACEILTPDVNREAHTAKSSLFQGKNHHFLLKNRWRIFVFDCIGFIFVVKNSQANITVELLRRGVRRGAAATRLRGGEKLSRK